jgi:hypothetical protein
MGEPFLGENMKPTLLTNRILAAFGALAITALHGCAASPSDGDPVVGN